MVNNFLLPWKPADISLRVRGCYSYEILKEQIGKLYIYCNAEFLQGFHVLLYTELHIRKYSHNKSYQCQLWSSVEIISLDTNPED